MLVPALVLALATAVTTSTLPGRYVVELPAPCGHTCRAALRTDLRQRTGETCVFAARTATIGAKAFLFLDCSHTRLSAMRFQHPPAVDALALPLNSPGMGGVVGKTIGEGGRQVRVVQDSTLRAFTVVTVAGEGGENKAGTAEENNTVVVPGDGDKLKQTAQTNQTNKQAPAAHIPLPWGADSVNGKKDGASCSPDRSQLGKDVNVYVLDAGCTPNPDVGLCATMVERGDDAKDCLDREGHGNHVAGTVGDPHVGVAPRCIVHCVKVLASDGTGKASEVISGIAKATDHFQKSKKAGGVLNLSLGGLVDGSSPVLESAIHAAAETGMFITLAAGNDDLDACGISPARTADGELSAGRIFTVQSHDSRHNPSGFSNWGKCTTISGPGEKILSTTDPGNFGYYSGTSQAAPHVAGAIAILLSDGRNVTIDSLTDGHFNQKNGFWTPILGITC